MSYISIIEGLYIVLIVACAALIIVAIFLNSPKRKP